MRNLKQYTIILMAGCGELHAASSTSFLQPLGRVAAEQRDHLLTVTLLSCIAILPVFVMVPYILCRYRYRNKSARYAPEWVYNKNLESLMWGLPIVISIAIGLQLWRNTYALDPAQTLPGDPICIEAVGLNWKWLFIYPQQRIASVNEFVIPVNRPVTIYLTTDTVMQSFRISALAGQIYAMPGMETRLNLIASEAGQSRGENTQYNGDGFADQAFSVRAVSKTEWREWTETADRALTESRYSRLAQPGLSGPAIYTLDTPHLYQRVLGRYRRGHALEAAQQPGSPEFVSARLPAWPDPGARWQASQGCGGAL